MTITRRNFLRGAAGAAAVLAAPAGLMALEPVAAASEFPVGVGTYPDLEKVDIYKRDGTHMGTAFRDSKGNMLHFEHPHGLGVGDVIFYRGHLREACFKGIERR